MFIPPKLKPQETLFMSHNKRYSILPTIYNKNVITTEKITSHLLMLHISFFSIGTETSLCYGLRDLLFICAYVKPYPKRMSQGLNDKTSISVLEKKKKISLI